MKKSIRAISAMLLIFSFCLIFGGCDMIDELREKHAIINEDKKAVIYQDKIFYRLPEGIPYFFNETDSNLINVTDYDVPVLLSEDFRYTGYYDPLSDIIAVFNEELVKGFYSDVIITYEGVSYTFYTTKENYEEYSTLSLEDADRIGFFNEYSDYNMTLLSSEASDEIFTLLENENKWSENIISKEITYNIFPMYRCNKAMTLKGEVLEIEINIYELDQVYLTNYQTGKQILLSDKTSEEIINKLEVY